MEIDIAHIIRNGTITELELALQQHPDLANSTSPMGTSWLLYSIYCRNTGAILLLKEKKSFIDTYEASALGELSLVVSLIKQNPDLVNQIAADGFSPLGLACYFGHFEVAKYLIEQGADVNAHSRNSFKVAPLHSACAISSMEIAELLLYNGANVNSRQQAGITALHEAAFHGKTDLVKLLIKFGADANLKADNGQTPLMMAEEKSFTKTVAFLKNA